MPVPLVVRRAAPRVAAVFALLAAPGLVAMRPAAQPRPTRPAVRPVATTDRLFSSAMSALEAPAERVIRTRPEWIEAWAGLGGPQPPTAPPDVDFERDMVVLVALGERGSGGHAVRVEGVSGGSAGSVTVHVTRTAPGPMCMTTQAVTSPVDVVRVPRAAGVVRFATRDVQSPC